MRKSKKLVGKLYIVAAATTILIAAVCLIYRFNNDKNSAASQNDKDKTVLIRTLKQATDQLRPTGFIESHSIGKKTVKDFYGNTLTLLPAVSNYYQNEYSVNEFSTSRNVLAAMGYTHEVDSVAGDFIDVANDSKTLEIGVLSRCFRSVNQPQAELCMTLLKASKTMDYIGGGHNQLNPFFNNGIETSKPYNFIVSARQYN
jgi:hypothetical protein